MPFLKTVTLRPDRTFDPDIYPFNLPAVRELHGLDLHPAVTYFVGENGTGKSTLLEAIAVACGFNAEGGTVNFNFSTRASHSDLSEFLRIARGVQRPRTGFFLRAESFYNVATQVDDLGAIESYGGVSLHEQSHGESFLALMLNRFGPDGLYLLDEPEAALSPMRQLAVLRRIDQLVKAGSQFVIATHAPIIMAYPNARLYLLDQTGYAESSWQDTEHVAVTQDFLRHPQRWLQDVFADDDPPDEPDDSARR